MKERHIKLGQPELLLPNSTMRDEFEKGLVGEKDTNIDDLSHL